MKLRVLTPEGSRSLEIDQNATFGELKSVVQQLMRVEEAVQILAGVPRPSVVDGLDSQTLVELCISSGDVIHVELLSDDVTVSANTAPPQPPPVVDTAAAATTNTQTTTTSAARASANSEEAVVLDCNICLDKCQDPVVVCGGSPLLPCGHLFCRSCVIEWTTRTDICPVCRMKITAVKAIGSGESQIESLAECRRAHGATASGGLESDHIAKAFAALGLAVLGYLVLS